MTCSNTEMDDGVMFMENKEKLIMAGRWCRKCGENTPAQVVLRKKDSYCKSCFLSSVTHKFRACLGKAKTMRPGDKVLIGFSGSDSALALLHLVNAGLQETSQKRLPHVDFLVVYIDESTALKLPPDQKDVVNDSIRDVLQKFPFPNIKVPLELSVESEEVMEAYLADNKSYTANNSITDMFTALTDVTSKMDLLFKLRQNVLAQTARTLGCNKVFTAETADDLAVKLLTNISLGRGAQLPYDVGFSDDRFSKLRIIRPLRDLSNKEIAMYNIFYHLQPVHVPSFLTKLEAHGSIHKLTETFLCELQSGFPSTLSTVFRVADKLTCSSENKNICSLCQAPMDMDSVASSSLNATQFSSLLSNSGQCNFDANNLTNLTDCCEGSNRSCQGKGGCSSKTPEEEIKETLCYGCSLIFRNIDTKQFPEEFFRKCREMNQRTKMKKEIEEFLL